MKFIRPELSAKRAAAGRIGGLQNFYRACGAGMDEETGRAEMSRRGKRGGRPRLKTLEELMASRDREENERGKGCTPEIPPLIARALGLVKKERGAAGQRA